MYIGANDTFVQQPKNKKKKQKNSEKTKRNVMLGAQKNVSHSIGWIAHTGSIVNVSRSSLASKFIAALWAFCVYYYCGSRIHSYLSFSSISFIYVIPFWPISVTGPSWCVLFRLFRSGYVNCSVIWASWIHLRNVCFVFSHAINVNLAKNRKQSHSSSVLFTMLISVLFVNFPSERF